MTKSERKTLEDLKDYFEVENRDVTIDELLNVPGSQASLNRLNDDIKIMSKATGQTQSEMSLLFIKALVRKHLKTK